MKYKNYRNSYTGDNRIYTNREIADMSVRDAFSRKEEILSQHKQIGIPSESELKASDNVVYVQAYTKDDGTEVKAHYRSKPDGVESNNLGATSIHKSEPNDKLTGGASEIEKDTEYTDYTVGEPIVDVSTPEKVQELMYPKEIAGVERGEPKTFFEMIKLGVNPKYMSDEDIDGEYSDNCQSCTVAAELVIRGYDVEAVGASNLVAQRLKSSNETAYISPITGKKCAYDIIFTNEISCYDYLEKNVKMGERYELSYNSPTESGNVGYDKEHEKDGHVVLITRDEQYGLMYYDPQDNKTLSGEQVRDYISTWFQYKEPVRAPRILRIDDKLLNPNYVNHVVRRRNGF